MTMSIRRHVLKSLCAAFAGPMLSVGAAHAQSNGVLRVSAIPDESPTELQR